MTQQQGSENDIKGQYHEITPEQLAYDLTLFANFITQTCVTKPRLFGVPRGGLIIAGYLAHLLDIRDVMSCPLDMLRAYVHLNVIKPTDLIIEDIYDSGNTYEEIRKDIYNVRVLHLYCKRRVPEPFGGFPQAVRPLDLPHETFVRFPWEKIADEATSRLRRRIYDI